MADKAQSTDAASTGETPLTPPAAAPARRGPGHRGADVRDTVAEMAARAHEISQEAGSKMAGAMKDVINAAAGLAGFAVESARDLVQYMVRRGQMTQDEADKLIREAEDAYNKRKPTEARSTTSGGAGGGGGGGEPGSAESNGASRSRELARGAATQPAPAKKAAEAPRVSKEPLVAKSAAPAKTAPKSTAKAAPAKAAAKGSVKAAAKKGAAKKVAKKKK